MTTMSIEIDDDLKREFSDVCHALGLPPQEAITVFAKAVVRERGFPFPITLMTSLERKAQTYRLLVTGRFW